MICPSCFRQIAEEDAEFCPHCGKHLVEASPQLESSAAVEQGLKEAEQILWRKDVYKGILNKHLVMSYIISNLRCYIWAEGEPDAGGMATGKIIAQLRITDCDVSVMNSRRISTSRGGGSYVSVDGLGVFSGKRSGTSRVFGDLYFTWQEKLYFAFPAVSDPQGVKSLVETLKKEYIRTHGQKWVP